MSALPFHIHDHVIKWKHFPRYWPFVRGIHRSPVNSPHNGRWRGALMFSLICTRLNGWVNNREAGDLRRYRTHYDVTVLYYPAWPNDDLMRYWISSLFPHVMRYRINRNLATNIDRPYRYAIMFWGRRGGFPLAGKRSQWTHDVMIASLLRQNVAATSF